MSFIRFKFEPGPPAARSVSPHGQRVSSGGHGLWDGQSPWGPAVSRESVGKSTGGSSGQWQVSIPHITDLMQSHGSAWCLKWNIFFSVNVIEEIANKMQNINNPIVAINTLLRELDLEADTETDTRATGTPL